MVEYGRCRHAAVRRPQWPLGKSVMNINRLLAWELIFIHALTGALFAMVNVLVLAHIGLSDWWVLALLTPLAVVSWAFWAYEAWIILRVTTDLRRSGDISRSRDPRKRS